MGVDRPFQHIQKHSTSRIVGMKIPPVRHPQKPTKTLGIFPNLHSPKLRVRTWQEDEPLKGNSSEPTQVFQALS